MKKILLTFLILLSTYSFAADVSGKVLLDKETTFENCTITFSPVSPSAVFSQVTSQINGTFIARIPNGVYNVKYEKEGYESYELSNFFFNGTIILDSITLYSNNLILVSGNVNGTWKKGNTYKVIGNILVPYEQTLIIEAGVEIKFDGYYSLIVHGTLLANGSPNNYITFTSLRTSPTNQDWNQIIIKDGQGSSKMNYCIVEYGKKSINDDTTSFLDLTGNFDLSNSIIRYTDKTGVTIRGYKKINITDNKIYNCSDGIVTNSPEYISGIGDVTINNNEVFNNTQDGLFFYGSSVILAKENIIYNCNIHGIRISTNSQAERNIIFNNGSDGITVVHSKPTILNNTIVFNRNGIGTNINAPDIKSKFIINSNIIANNLNYGIYSQEATKPDLVSYNLIYNNNYGIGNLLPLGVGPIITTNINNTPSDAYYNIFVDPEFESTVPTDNNFSYLKSTSPAIDAGDPSLRTSNGTIVDIGATELGGNLSVIKNELSALNVKVFPNPVSDYLNFQSTDIRTFNSIMIYDLNGKTIDAINTKNQESEFNWKVPGHLKNGVYMYQVRNNNTILGSGKFIKK